MNFDPICDYLTCAEVAVRWRVEPGSLMIRRAIARGILKPCFFFSSTTLQRMEIGATGQAVPLLIDGAPVLENVRQWLYPRHEFKEQIAPFEFSFPLVSDMCELVKGSNIYATPAPMLLSHLLLEGCVMMPDVQAADRNLQPADLGTKEENSLLKLVSVMLADCYRFNPDERSGTAKELSETSKQLGQYLSDGAILKWARRAATEFPTSAGARPGPVALVTQPAGAPGAQQAARH